MVIKNRMKKLILMSPLLFICVTYDALSGMIQCKDDKDISTPCIDNRWDFSGDGLYLSSGALKQYSDRISPTANNVSWSQTAADYGWGYRLAAAYHFSTGNALLLDWSHYRNTTQNISDSSGSIPQDVSVTSKFDIANLSMQQIINIGESFNLGIVEGLNYAHLIEDFRLEPTNTAFTGTTFDGIGIRLGLEGAYDFQHVLSLYANAAFTMLYGKEVYLNTSAGPQGLDQRLSQMKFYKAGDTSIGLRYKNTIAQGELITTVAWDNYYYSLNWQNTGFTWTGLRVGTKYLA